MSARTPKAAKDAALPAGYAGIHGGIVELLDAARQAAARNVNALMTASYWEIGRRIVEAEQQGKRRAGYGEQLIARLSADLAARFGRGFSPDNLEHMRRFFAAYPRPVISEALSRKSGDELPAEISETVSRQFTLDELAQVFPLPWSAYVRLLAVKDDHARRFYEAEALRGGWSVRQLDRQIGSQFYERTALSKDKAAMLVKGAIPRPEDAVRPSDAIKDPYVLEFLNLKDEYSDPAAGGFSAGAGRRVHLRRAAAALAHRPDVVSGGLAAVPSQVALPGHHRPEAGQSVARGRGPDAHVLQLRQGALGLSR